MYVHKQATAVEESWTAQVPYLGIHPLKSADRLHLPHSGKNGHNKMRLGGWIDWPKY